MARAHTCWVIHVNGTPTKAFTVKHEAQSWLRDLKGWNLIDVWRMPDGQYPLFKPEKLTKMEFLER